MILTKKLRFGLNGLKPSIPIKPLLVADLMRLMEIKKSEIKLQAVYKF